MVRNTYAVIATLALVTSGAARADWSDREARQVSALVERFLQAREGKVVPAALSLSIGVRGKMVFASGFGMAGAGRRATAETTYHIGSLTKQFTAAATLKLVESGARAPLSGKPLRLDTPVREILEGVDGWSAAGAPPVALSSLLSMTSNLPNFTKHPPAEADPWGAIESTKLLTALSRQAPHGWPNTFEYSNTGYFVLAHVIEAVLSGAHRQASARDYVRENLLDAAGLKHTGFVDDDPKDPDAAEPSYHRRPAFARPHWLDGCGDMKSNVVDLFAWNRVLMDGSIIGAASRAAMFSDAARVDPLTYYGMGWFIRHDDAWDSYYHSGSVPGFTSYNAILRRRDDGRWVSVSLLTNSDGVEGLDALADDILDVVRALQ